MQRFAIGKVWRLLSRTERRRAVILLVLMFVGMALETVGIGLIVPVIALLTEPDYMTRVPALEQVLAALGHPNQVTLVLGAMLALALAFTMKNAFLAFLTFRQMQFAFDLQAHLSQRLFATYLGQPYVFHLQRNSAQLLANVTTEVSHFATHAMVPGMLMLSETLVLLGLFVLLVLVEPVGALVVISVLGAAAWGFHHLTRNRLTRWGILRQQHEASRIQHLQQGFGAVKDIKLLGREGEFLDAYRVHNSGSARMDQLQTTVFHLPRLWLELLAVVGLAVLVAVMLWQGRPVAAIMPTVALFAAAAFRLMPSANRALAGIQALRYGLPVIDMLYRELQLPSLVSDKARPVVPFRSAVRFDNVRFAYPGAASEALVDLSLHVGRGESVGIIGPSGAGKSTLVDVLLGLLEPTAGDVRVDERSIREDIRGWQSQIGYVPQSLFLTDDTLRRNVAFGLTDDRIDEPAVWRAIRAAQLEEFVRSLPNGLDTEVGERGVRLSGGQRQRIGIARALYYDPAVLVLDEATSSLDTATEHGVMQAVRALHGAKTVVIVAHRFSTVEHCDRLYRLEAGKVAAEGPPATVLSHRQSG